MMFLLSISDALEDYTLQKAKSTLKDSLALNIDTVWVVGEDGEEKQCAAVDIDKGDKIKVHMGDVWKNSSCRNRYRRRKSHC